MRPSLPERAVLLVEPYGERKIRRGDIIVYPLDDSSETIVHRVVSVTKKGLVTKGDANDDVDRWTVNPEKVIGKVVFMGAGKNMKPIGNGLAGSLIAAAVRARRFAARLIVPVVRPLLSARLLRRPVSRLWNRFCKPRVVCFEYHGQPSFCLMIGGRTIGRFETEQRAWHLMRPYATFVDVEALPRPKIPSTENRLSESHTRI